MIHDQIKMKYGEQSSGGVVSSTASLRCSVVGHQRRIVKGGLSEAG